jgi:hypothetical protein
MIYAMSYTQRYADQPDALSSDLYITKEDRREFGASSDSEHDSNDRLTGHKPSSRFNPQPDDHPEDLSIHDARELSLNPRAHQPRMVRRSEPRDEILIYTDGSCLDQHISGDSTQRKAGCGVVFRPQPRVAGETRGISLRLESSGSTGEYHPQTSNRAELQAAIAALETRIWYGEG